jgi:predicted nucleic acid-binding protein
MNPVQRGGGMVLVDTPVWSLALRRKPGDLNPREQDLTRELADLIREGRAQIVGVVRQELLSGIRDQTRFEKLREYLRAFDEPYLTTDDYEVAAQMHNRCRTKGIAGSAVDFMVCAAAHRRGWKVFTTDRDFQRYERVLGLALHSA